MLFMWIGFIKDIARENERNDYTNIISILKLSDKYILTKKEPIKALLNFP